MSLGGLLNSRHDRFVNSERDGSSEGQERQVSKDADEREHRESEEDGKPNAEHDSRLLDIAPVDQWLHCEVKKKFISRQKF